MLVDGELTLGELRRLIAESYYLDDEIVSRLILCHCRPTGNDGDRRPRYYLRQQGLHPPIYQPHERGGGGAP